MNICSPPGTVRIIGGIFTPYRDSLLQVFLTQLPSPQRGQNLGVALQVRTCPDVVVLSFKFFETLFHRYIESFFH